MAKKIAVFMNLPSNHPDVVLREKDLEGLPGNTFKYKHGGAQPNYLAIAQALVQDNPDADVFVATCWPTLDALQNAVPPGKKIVFVGLIDSPGRAYNANVTGLKSFDSKVLCPFWPALLLAVAPGLKNVAVIYDEIPAQLGMRYEETVVESNWKFFSPPNTAPALTQTPANHPSNQQPTNPDIAGGIATFLQGVGNNPAGLIVTGGTRTTMLRDDIVTAVKNRNKTANKLFAIYPSRISWTKTQLDR
jgi:hypothetical protein